MSNYVTSQSTTAEQRKNKYESQQDSILLISRQGSKRGEIIGTIGTSGRSTGPHLDIRLNWFKIKLDPKTILEIK